MSARHVNMFITLATKTIIYEYYGEILWYTYNDLLPNGKDKIYDSNDNATILLFEGQPNATVWFLRILAGSLSSYPK